MANPLVTFNNWYDALTEPWRFIVGFVLVALGLAALAFGSWLVKILGAAFLVLLVIIRILDQLKKIG